MRAMIFASLLLFAVPAAMMAQESRPDPWGPLRFMLGEWTTAGLAKPEAGSGVTSFSLELGGQVIVRKNRAEYPAAEAGAAPAVHEDLMVIYPDPQGFRAIYFDNETHVIEYDLLPAEKEGVAFVSRNREGPRFKLLYRLLPDGTLAVEFAIARPGGEFAPYLQGRIRRRDANRQSGPDGKTDQSPR